MVMSDSEVACVYAALILQDEGLEISVEMIEKIINASGLVVENIYPKIFAKALKGKNIKELFFNIGSASVVPAVTGDAATGVVATEEKKIEEKEEEEEEEEEDESDDDFVISLFD